MFVSPNWVSENQGEFKYYLLSLFSIIFPAAWLYAFSYPKTLLLTWTPDHKQIQSIERQIANMAGGQEKHLQNEKKSHRCSQCNYLSKNLNNLKRHLLVHSGEKPFPCLQCDSSFRDPGNLKRHTLIHSGDKLFSCNTPGFCHAISCV